MGKRREARYGARLTILITTDTARRLREASNQSGIAESVIARRALDAGMRQAIASVRPPAAEKEEG